MADFSGIRLLVFRIADLMCAVEVHAVREIGPVPRATRIPGAAGPVDGLVNVRGELVPLVDGARLLARTARPGDQTMVLLTHAARGVGLVVDEVLDLFAVPPDDLSDRDGLPGLDPRLVRAVGHRGGRTFVLLDLEALLGPILTT
jgi:purine-binding chemotaxis protein CheW